MSQEISFGVAEDRQATQDTPVHGQQIVVRFVKFHREQGDPSTLYKRRKVKWGYEETEGKVYKRGTTVPIAPQEATGLYEFRVQMEFELVTPVESAGQSMPFSSSLKGIFLSEKNGQMHVDLSVKSSDRRPGLMDAVLACGFNGKAIDPTSPVYKPGYLAPYLVNLPNPPSVDSVLLEVIEPILKAKAAAGHLVAAQTQPTSNWIKTYSLSPLSAEEAAIVARTAQPAPDPVAEGMPFPGNEEVLGTAITRAQMAAVIKSAPQANIVSGREIIEHLQEEKIPYDSEAASIIDSLKDEGIKAVYDWVVEREAAKKEPTL